MSTADAFTGLMQEVGMSRDAARDGEGSRNQQQRFSSGDGRSLDGLENPAAFHMESGGFRRSYTVQLSDGMHCPMVHFDTQRSAATFLVAEEGSTCGRGCQFTTLQLVEFPDGSAMLVPYCQCSDYWFVVEARLDGVLQHEVVQVMQQVQELQPCHHALNLGAALRLPSFFTTISDPEATMFYQLCGQEARQPQAPAAALVDPVVTAATADGERNSEATTVDEHQGTTGVENANPVSDEAEPPFIARIRFGEECAVERREFTRWAEVQTSTLPHGFRHFH